MSSNEKKLCYVIMPFSEHAGISEPEWTKTYSSLFKPTIEDIGLSYVCERSTIRQGDYLKDIIYNLKNARVVLADITDHNPNVMWELGVRHALSKRTIVVHRKHTGNRPIISDMSNYGIIPYSVSDLEEIDAFKKKIKELLLDIERNPERSDNPVFDHIREEDLIISSAQRRIIKNKLVGLLSELSFNLNLAESMLRGEEMLDDKKQNTLNRFITTAMRDMLASNYASLHDIKEQENFVIFLRVSIRNMEAINLSLDNVIFNPDLKKKTMVEQMMPFIHDTVAACKRLLAISDMMLKQQKQGYDLVGEPIIIVADEEHRKYFGEFI
jgi:hypothetical protein